MFNYRRALPLFLLQSLLAHSADSLIDPAQYRSLFSDQRALVQGDLLTVLVLESTTAEQSASTGESSDFSVQAKAFDPAGAHNAGLAVGGAAEGEGKTSRRGVVKAHVSVRVIEVLSNNVLRIQGNQQLTVNGETQTVSITGLIRVQDISRDNTVMSNRISDAVVEIAGDGDVSNAQRHSIIYRVLKWLNII